MKKHTPGPWHVVGPNNDRVAVRRDLVIADCHLILGPMDRETREANARLIAAAPTMLAALEQIAGFFIDSDPEVRQVLEAIRLARGERRVEVAR